LHTFLTLALDGGEWSASCRREETPGTYFIGGWLGPTAGLDVTVKRKISALLPIEPSHYIDCANPDHNMSET